MAKITRREMLQSTTTAVSIPLLAQLGGVHVFGQEAKPTPKPKKKPDPYADAVLQDGAPAMTKEGNFTIVVLPDTQHYEKPNEEIFAAQTEWVVDNREERRIASVLHLGDITNNNRRSQWEVAQAAMKQLDDKVPYFMALGNHDYGKNGRTDDRSTLFHEYFPIKEYRKLPNFGGSYDKEPNHFDNTYHFFSAGGQDFLVLSLEFGARKDVVRWANEVLDKYPKHPTILITHAYMYYDDTRYDFKKYGTKQNWNPHKYPIGRPGSDDVSDGEELWNDLVKQHEQVILTLNGHVIGDGLGQLTSKNAAGKNVHQLLVNFQMRPKGGDGWLRILEFSNRDKTIDVIDFSPTRNQCNLAKENHFTLALS